MAPPPGAKLDHTQAQLQPIEATPSDTDLVSRIEREILAAWEDLTRFDRDGSLRKRLDELIHIFGLEPQEEIAAQSVPATNEPVAFGLAIVKNPLNSRIEQTTPVALTRASRGNGIVRTLLLEVQPVLIGEWYEVHYPKAVKEEVGTKPLTVVQRTPDGKYYAYEVYRKDKEGKEEAGDGSNVFYNSKESELVVDDGENVIRKFEVPYIGETRHRYPGPTETASMIGLDITFPPNPAAFSTQEKILRCSEDGENISEEGLKQYIRLLKTYYRKLKRDSLDDILSGLGTYAKEEQG